MLDKNKTGIYIVLEGADFCGKSTLANELVSQLKKIYGDEKVVHRREPSSEGYGAKMRETLFSGEMTTEKEILASQYMLLDRIQNNAIVSGLLREDKIVIQERNFLTALVYNEARDTEEVKFVQLANELTLKPDFLALITVADSTIKYRLEVAKDKGIKLDQYETFEKISQRSKEYFKFCEYIDLVMSNDSEKFLNHNISKIMSMINEKMPIGGIKASYGNKTGININNVLNY